MDDPRWHPASKTLIALTALAAGVPWRPLIAPMRAPPPYPRLGSGFRAGLPMLLRHETGSGTAKLTLYVPGVDSPPRRAPLPTIRPDVLGDLTDWRQRFRAATFAGRGRPRPLAGLVDVLPLRRGSRIAWAAGIFDALRGTSTGWLGVAWVFARPFPPPRRNGRV